MTELLKVIGLKDAKGIYVTSGVKNDNVTHQYLYPCLSAFSTGQRSD